MQSQRIIEHLYSPQVVAKKIKNTNSDLNKQRQCTIDKQRIREQQVNREAAIAIHQIYIETVIIKFRQYAIISISPTRMSH